MYSEVRVIEHIPPKSSKQPYRVIVEDDTEPLTLIFFKAYVDSLQRNLPVGEERVISGKLDSFNGFWQMSHPDYIVKPAEMDKVLGIETVYPLTAGISNKMLNKWIKQALERVPAFPEWLNEEYRKKQNWLGFKDALSAAHNPKNADELLPQSPARMRLAYDELLANQLALAIVRQRVKNKPEEKFAETECCAKNIGKAAFQANSRARKSFRRNLCRPRVRLQDAAPVAGRCRSRKDHRGANDDA